MYFLHIHSIKLTDTPGYDTHGLPIEVQIKKELGIKNKQEIFEFEVDKFIKIMHTRSNHHTIFIILLQIR